MSLDATIWAWKQNVRPTEKLVLLSLADRADEDHSCYPSTARLEKDTGLYRETIFNSIKTLESQGILSVKRILGKGNFYQLIGVNGRHDQSVKPDQSENADQYGKPDSTSMVKPTPTSMEKPTHNLPLNLSIISTSDQALPDHEKSSLKIPNCPQQEIISLYAKHLATLPQPKIWEGKRAGNLRARWRWLLTAKRGNGSRYATDVESALDFFDRFFNYVSASEFLTGRDDKWQGCDLAWLVKAENFAKVIEGKYENRQEVAA